jgi:Cys-tRNA(Pro) deacylase
MGDTGGSERAIAALDDLGLDYRVVRTAAASSAEESAQLQGVDLGQLLKTIVIRKGVDDHVFVLVPADREIDWRKLRAALGVSRASIPSREEAESVTGYSVGAITPFGSSRTLQVFLDSAAMGHELVALGGGERGVNLHLEPVAVRDGLQAVVAVVTSERAA